MPTMPKPLPRRAVACVLKPPKLRMNSTPATRYEMVIRLAGIVMLWLPGAAGHKVWRRTAFRSFLLPLKHLQHALGNQEPAGDIDRRDQHRDRRQDGHRRGDWTGNLQHAADQDDAA